MAFRDEDIRRNGPRSFGSVTRYQDIGIPGGPDGEGKEPHKAKFRREADATFTLAEAQHGCGWRKLSESK